MSKRNFILLIIILGIAVGTVYGILYLRRGLTGKTTTIGDSINFISQFSPFSNIKPTPEEEQTPVDGEEPEQIIPTEEVETRLRKVSSMPVAGFAVFQKERLKEVPIIKPIVDINSASTTANITNPSGTQALVAPKEKTVKKSTKKPVPPATEFAAALRYVDKTSGNIYQTFADKIEERKFSETVIPRVYEAYFTNKGESVLMRYLKTDERTIETFVGNLPKEKLGEDLEPGEIDGAFLPDNITDLSISTDTSKIFYLLNNGGNSIGTILNLPTSKKTQIFDSTFTEWLPSWPNSKNVTLTTKPSGIVAGYLYMLDVDKKSFLRVLGGINGLTTLTSPSGKLVLYNNNLLSQYIYSTDKKTTEPFGVKTLPEKCVWSKTNEFMYCAVPKEIPGGTYPDDWYRGEVSFTDQIWKISLLDGSTALVIDPITVPEGEEIDGIKLALDEKEEYLFFVNKKDSFLWKLDLK